MLAVDNEVKYYGLARLLDQAGMPFSRVARADVHHLDPADGLLIVDACDVDATYAVAAVPVLMLVNGVAGGDLLALAGVECDGYLDESTMDAASLVDAMNAAARGQMLMPPAMARALFARSLDAVPPERPRGPVSLTDRELQTLGLLVEGLSNKQVARRLGVSIHGAKRLVASLLAKLNCPNRTTAATVALQEGLCRIDDPVGRAGS